MSFTFDFDLTNSHPITNGQTNPRFDKEPSQDPHKDDVKATLSQCLMLNVNNVYGNNANAVPVGLLLGGTGGGLSGKIRLNNIVSSLTSPGTKSESEKACKSFDNQSVTLDKLVLIYTAPPYQEKTPIFFPTKYLLGNEEVENTWRCEKGYLHQYKNGKYQIELKLDGIDVRLVYPKYAQTPQFRGKIEVFVDGEQFATIRYLPISTLTYKDTDIELKIQNQFLYKNWHKNLVLIEKLLGINDVRTSSFDIAVDSPKGKVVYNQGKKKDNKTGILTMLNNWHKCELFGMNTNLTKKGRAKINTVGFDRALKEYETFYIGTYGSQKFIRVYDKSKEIGKDKKNEHKASYIEPFWEANGLDTSEGVERIEISLRSAKIKKIDGLTVDMLADSEFLASIMKTECENFFHFVEKKGENISRAKEVSLIDFDSLGGIKLERVKAKTKGEMWGVRRECKRLTKQYLLLGSDTAIKHLSWLCDHYNGDELRKWVAKKWPYWLEELSKRIVPDLSNVEEFGKMIEDNSKDLDQLYQSGYYCPNGYPAFWDSKD